MDRLLAAGFIQEVHYPKWISNVVLVKKASEKWQMCVDFTDLNKACPKDSFPLPHIDPIVDSTVGHPLLNFMDAYLGYNQIRMNPDDEEKTAFVTDRGSTITKRCSLALRMLEQPTNGSLIGCSSSRSAGIWKYTWTIC